MDLNALLPQAELLVAAAALDLALGDPVYRWHPVRLVGRSIRWCEAALRKLRADGRLGGCVLFVAVAAPWSVGISVSVIAIGNAHALLASALHLFLLYSLVALGDLLKHGNDVNAAASTGNLSAARAAVRKLVGRDTDGMDAGACRRAAIESVAENLVDGFVSPVFWYALAGLPGIIVFKIVSTMDSMVGYKTARYLRFGWCGARLDDLLNLVPARLSWLMIAGTATVLPGCSGRNAATLGWRQHGSVPGPNSGWSEAAMAGAIQRRLVGPIWAGGLMVTDLWLGKPSDPEAGNEADYRRATHVAVATAGAFLLLAVGHVSAIRP